jgi:hypothetical protein
MLSEIIHKIQGRICTDPYGKRFGPAKTPKEARTTFHLSDINPV